jgi:hypothetical protein
VVGFDSFAECSAVVDSIPEIEVGVLTYPANEVLLHETVEHVENLFDHLNGSIGPVVAASVVDLRGSTYSSFAGCLEAYLGACLDDHRGIDVRWLFALDLVLKVPTEETIAAIEARDIHLLDDATEGVRGFLRQIVTQTDPRPRPPKALFVARREHPLVQAHEGLWGVSYGQYPLAVTIEIKGYRESVYHEVLHEFGASEGYDEDSKKTLVGCEGCWMQFKGTSGSGLCPRHLGEAKQFLANLEFNAE